MNRKIAVLVGGILWLLAANKIGNGGLSLRPPAPETSTGKSTEGRLRTIATPR